jgi:hypothetical protein
MNIQSIKTDTCEFSIGNLVTADHPITVLNPDRNFKIFQIECDSRHVRVRGENTMWFGESLVTKVKE